MKSLTASVFGHLWNVISGFFPSLGRALLAFLTFLLVALLKKQDPLPASAAEAAVFSAGLVAFVLIDHFAVNHKSRCLERDHVDLKRDFQKLNEEFLHSVRAIDVNKAESERVLEVKFSLIKKVTSLIIRQMLARLHGTTADRVTLYLVEAHATQASLVERYSPDNVFTQRRRNYFQLGETVIGRAWRKGSFKKSIYTKKGLEKFRKRCGLQREVIESLVMPSKRYVAHRIESTLKTYNVVVIFESTDPWRLRGFQIRTLQKSALWETMEDAVAHYAELTAYHPKMAVLEKKAIDRGAV